MELKDFFTMNGGDGENSYAHNSHLARKVLVRTKPYLLEAIEDLLQDMAPLKLFTAADLGCSSGPNAIFTMATIIEKVEKIHRIADKKPPEIQFLLNDLPSNDFNSLFRGLPSLTEGGVLSCFVMGAPGSFHGSLFPTNYLHFVHSSYSVHWLSQVPVELTGGLNKGNIYISKTSPPCVWKAYLNQFDEDFCSFLQCRGKEMVENGRMVLIMQGRPNADPCSEVLGYEAPLLLLTQALSELVSQRRVEEKKLDEWNIPYYAPSREELKKIIEREGSFVIQKFDTLDLDVGDETMIDVWMKAKQRCMEIRAFSEPLIDHQFGEGIKEDLYGRVLELVADDFLMGRTAVTNFLLILKKEVDNCNESFDQKSNFNGKI